MSPTPEQLEIQGLRIRVAVLEDRILTHRMMVRDGWQPKWKKIPDANQYLWAVLQHNVVLAVPDD